MGVHQITYMRILFSHRKLHPQPIWLALRLVSRDYRQFNHKNKGKQKQPNTLNGHLEYYSGLINVQTRGCANVQMKKSVELAECLFNRDRTVRLIENALTVFYEQ